MAARRKANREEFTRLAAEGATNKELRDHFQISEATVSRLRKLTATATAPRLTPERKARIDAMIADGWSFKEIRRTEGADMSTLRRHYPGHQWTKAQARDYQEALRIVATPTYADGATALGIRDIATSHLASERKAQREYRAQKRAA